MKDPKRIDEITEKLREAWHLHPNWTFGQLIVKFFLACEECLEVDELCFIDDLEWQAALQAFINGTNPAEAMYEALKEHNEKNSTIDDETLRKAIIELDEARMAALPDPKDCKAEFSPGFLARMRDLIRQVDSKKD